MTITFTVFGIPQPKGSTQSFGYIAKDAAGNQRTRTTKFGKVVPVIRTATKSDNPKNTGWQQAVAIAALAALANVKIAAPGFASPVILSVDFYLQRPKSVRARRQPHTTRPDLDKLARSVCDALTGVAWVDDGQVVELIARKAYAELDQIPRAEITIMPAGSCL